MFKCDLHNGFSNPGEVLRLVVTKWRLKAYPAKELPPVFGSNTKRWSKVGEGFEADEVKKSCSSCDGKSAPIPRQTTSNIVPIPSGR